METIRQDGKIILHGNEGIFVRNIKMKRACMMLLARTQTISEVAYAVGFSNPKYFTKCFKEEFGVTPTEYQQSHIKA